MNYSLKLKKWGDAIILHLLKKDKISHDKNDPHSP